MTPALASWRFDLAVVTVGALATFLVIGAVFYVLELAAGTRARRELVARARPVVFTTLGIAFLLLGVGAVFDSQPESQPFALGLAVLAVAAASWFFIRDVLAGVVIRAGRIVSVGDQLRVGDISGRVVTLGTRVVVFETTTGQEAIVPYSDVARATLVRTPVLQGLVPHVFSVRVTEGHEQTAVKREIQRRAMCCHWSAITRPPRITAVGERDYEVTVFSLHGDHVREIELAVRASPVVE